VLGNPPSASAENDALLSDALALRLPLLSVPIDPAHEFRFFTWHRELPQMKRFLPTPALAGAARGFHEVAYTRIVAQPGDA
jgi:hypothetical protein